MCLKERWCAAQCIAYAIYITPVFFMWEKLIGTHYKPNWIRLPSRLPVGEPSFNLQHMCMRLWWRHVCGCCSRLKDCQREHSHCGKVVKALSVWC